ncbi:MAG: tetratricopeptide repeat protein [Bacteroidota bacterium]
MFGLFKNKSDKPTVTPEDKEWVEQVMIWLIESFGMDGLKKLPFILPTPKQFPYSDLNDLEQFQKLFEKLCKHLEVDSNTIIVKFFDDIFSKQWTNWMPLGTIHEEVSEIVVLDSRNEKQFQIQLAKSNLKDPELLVAVIVHELVQVKLIGGEYITQQDLNLEAITDLASIYFGFGIFIANTCESKGSYWVKRIGYLSEPVISYSSALICYITGRDYRNYIDFLNDNTKFLFRQDCEFLINTDDTELTEDRLAESEIIYDITCKIENNLLKGNHDAVIEAAYLRLKKIPKDRYSYNTIGYSLIQQKKYDEAIIQLTKAIEIDHYWPISFTDRGYCNLQLGNIENAFTDIHSAFQMDPQNYTMIRNMGAYYLKVENFTKALDYFEKALLLNPKTELINFYLGHTHLKMGNEDQAKLYFEKSVELNEYNDSLIK